MKKLTPLLSVLLFLGTLTAQAGQPVTVPQTVSSAFTARFPKARVRRWMEKPEGFIAEFKMDHKTVYAYFKADGVWAATETQIHWPFHIPPAVRKGWRDSDYAAWYLIKMSRIETPEKTMYSLDINNFPVLNSEHMYNDADELVLFFSEQGQLVRRDQR